MGLVELVIPICGGYSSRTARRSLLLRVVSTKRFRVKICPDRLEAWVEVLPGPATGGAELRRALFEAGVLYGIDEEFVATMDERLARTGFQHKGLLAARGRPPHHGEDGELMLHYNLTARMGHGRADGGLELVEPKLQRPVRKGDVVAYYRPPTFGSSGIGVDDSERRARDGRDRMPELGSGVWMDAGREIRATADGVIILVQGELLDVVKESGHRGDVDLRSGSLEAQGSLVVRGRVRQGYRVRATGTTEIRLGVEGGSVFAGGNISIGGGIVGGEGARILAVGDVSSRFVENAEIDCGGELRVANDILTSRLRVGAVDVKGRLAGGELVVDGRVRAGELGSSAGQVTRIWAGVMRREHIDIGKRSTAWDRPANDQAHDEEERPSSQKKVVRVRNVAAEISATLEIAYVEADLVHPGVTISIGGRQWIVHQMMRHVRFRFDPDYNAIVIARRGGEYAA